VKVIILSVWKLLIFYNYSEEHIWEYISKAHVLDVLGVKEIIIGELRCSCHAHKIFGVNVLICNGKEGQIF